MAILRKIKEKLSKVKLIKKTVRAKKTGFSFRRIKDTKKAAADNKEFLGQQETEVGKTKFYAAESPRASRLMPQDLPGEYGHDKIVLQVRDAWWIHSYWEITGSTYDRLKNDLKDEFYKAKRLLRVYDVTNIMFDGSNANRFFDIQINDYSTSWYIDTGGPGRSWCVDLGLLLSDGKFITIVRSNTVCTPIEGPSWVTDEEWMIPEDMFARLYGMGFGLGRSSPVGRAWQERIKRELYSGVLSSPGVTSLSSPVGKVPGERKFWLTVHTELIVYGATEADAQVFVQDKKINLRHDGTFTMRFALPDGKQVIPVKAISSDNKEERKITPIVAKETK